MKSGHGSSCRYEYLVKNDLVKNVNYPAALWCWLLSGPLGDTTASPCSSFPSTQLKLKSISIIPDRNPGLFQICRVNCLAVCLLHRGVCFIKFQLLWVFFCEHLWSWQYERKMYTCPASLTFLCWEGRNKQRRNRPDLELILMAYSVGAWPT